MGGTQSHCRIDHATEYLAMADTTHAFLLKKREFLHKALIIFGVVMIWLSSTNYLAVQLTNALGSIITWSSPLDLKVLENKHNVNQSIKQSRPTNSSKPGAEQAIVILGGERRSGAIEYPQYQYQNIAAGAMERVRYGVPCPKQHVSILLTGGDPDATSTNELTEGELTQKVLNNEFQIQAR